MGKNSSLYNQQYHSRQRKALVEHLGGKCEVCGIEQDLIIHRIFSGYNSKGANLKPQSTFDGTIGEVNKFTPVSEAVLKMRNKLLKSHPDNMVLLCPYCYTALRRIHGRKKKIGRKEIAYFKGEF